MLDRDPNELVSTTTSFKLKIMDEKKMMEGNRMGNRGPFFLRQHNNTNFLPTPEFALVHETHHRGQDR